MGKTMTSTQKNEPPAWAKPLLTTSAKDAMALYKGDKGFNVYQGDRVANMNTMQNDAMSQFAALGNNQSNTDMNKASINLADIANGFHNPAEAQYDALGGMNNSADFNSSRDIFNSLGGQGDPSSAESNLSAIARGDNLYGDARFQEMLDRQSSKIADTVGQQFSSAGRYGSGANQGAIAGQVGDFRRQSVLDNYAAERQRQLQAVNAIDSARQGQQGLRLSAGSQLAALGQNRFSNALNAAQARDNSEINQQQLRLGASGQLAQQGQNRFQNALQAAQAQLGAGTMQQQQAQAERDAQMAKWKETDMQDWTRLGALQAAASGAAGPYGMMTGTQTQPFNPLGILGTLGSFFSDRRLKQDICRVGEKNGFPIYEFRYRGKDARRWRGVMAQDVIEKRPDAVEMAPDGFFRVNYHALGLAMEAA